MSGPSQIPITILHHRDYYLAQRHVKELRVWYQVSKTPKPALFLLHSSFCAHLLHLAAQAQSSAEEASSLRAEVECISSMASVLTPPPRASSAKNHLHPSCMQETGGHFIKMKTIKTPRRERHPLKNKNNDEVKKSREFSASTLVERSPKEKAIPREGTESRRRA